MLPAANPLSRSPRPSGVAVVALWIFITLASMAMTAAAQSLKTGKIDVIDRVIWDSGWLGWIPLTYVVLALCRKHPVDRDRKVFSVARLAGYGIVIVAAQMAFDFACNAVLGTWLRNAPFTWMNMLYIAVYKGHIYYGVYWMIVGAAHAYEFHGRYLRTQLLSSQLEAKLAQAELSLLKRQLQPHFLFNTHNAIVALMLKQDSPAAIRMLTRLSDLLRISLSHSRKQLVPLGEELATLRLYLDIQCERFRDRLQVEWDAPEDLHDAQVPHFLLQPLVENALSHGLGDVTENAVVEVRARREADSLILTVRDNGAGFAASSADNSRGARAAGGVGLSNTQERLQQLYGESQSIDIESALGAGCLITIRIPYVQNRALETVQ